MVLAKDPGSSGGRARAFDQGLCGEILYASNFGENMYDGWRAQLYGAHPGLPVGLVSYPTHSGKLALQLSTEMRAYSAGNLGTSCATFRSLSLYTQRQYLSLSAFLAVGADTWGSFGLVFDIQKADDSSRSYAQLSINQMASPDYSKVAILGNSQTPIEVTGHRHVWPGDNENKQGFGYMRLTWDLLANGGLGGYYEAQIQNTVIDLTGAGGGSGSDAPQTDTSEGTTTGIGEFNGGLNIGLLLTRQINPGAVDEYPSTLVADSIVLSNHA
jgi:hypothetical protein